MRSDLLCDNDVILKSCSYDLSLEVLIFLQKIGDFFILGSAAYVVSDRITRSRTITDKGTARHNFELFVEQANEIEPSDSEVELAAELESIAQALNLSLDSGESLLLAVLLRRASFNLVLTGDKRAIEAIQILSGQHEEVAKLVAQLCCLEQLFLSLLKFERLEILQNRVCKERHVDIALANCFSCASGRYTLISVSAGLLSYINSLRAMAGRVMLKSDTI